MSNECRDIRIPAKTCGWGGGLPVRWQGRVIVAAYLLLIVFSTGPVRERAGGLVLTGYVVLLTALFIASVAWKGERPAGWRVGPRLTSVPATGR